jgi:hypothetical protein
MNPQQMEQMRLLLYQAILKQLNTPYRSEGYYGGFKKGNSPRKASGSLIRGLRVEWVIDVEQGDPMLEVFFEDVTPEFLPDIIDQGRKPSLSYPPLDAIRNWIRVKPVLWRDERGRFKAATPDTKAFLIARSIKEKGFKGINFMTKAEDQVLNELTELGEEAMAVYFQKLLDDGLVNLID